jgi:hypothetical protein
LVLAYFSVACFEFDNGPFRFFQFLLCSAELSRGSDIICPAGKTFQALPMHADYFVLTARRGEHPERWSWEIRRKSKPLGIKMTGDGYQSESAAQFAGKRALENFLADLSREESRARR